MKFILLKDFDDRSQLLQMAKEHAGYKRLPRHGNVLLVNRQIKGYAFFKKRGRNQILLDWIWAPGYGTQFLKHLENSWKRSGIKQVILKVSIDPTESKTSVIKRINFYIKMNYQVSNLKFRPKYGPLLTMVKDLSK